MNVLHQLFGPPCNCLGCTGDIPQKVADAWYTYLKAREAYEATKVVRFPIERTRAGRTL